MLVLDMLLFTLPHTKSSYYLHCYLLIGESTYFVLEFLCRINLFDYSRINLSDFLPFLPLLCPLHGTDPIRL